MAPDCASGVCEPLDPRVAPDGSTKHRASPGVVGLPPSPPAVSKALRLGSGDLVSRRSSITLLLSDSFPFPAKENSKQWRARPAGC